MLRMLTGWLTDWLTPNAHDASHSSCHELLWRSCRDAHRGRHVCVSVYVHRVIEISLIRYWCTHFTSLHYSDRLSVCDVNISYIRTWWWWWLTAMYLLCCASCSCHRFRTQHHVTDLTLYIWGYHDIDNTHSIAYNGTALSSALQCFASYDRPNSLS